MLTICLLTHNRPVQAMEAIESILAQRDRRFRLVISDNSSTDELRYLIGNQRDVQYIKRPAMLSGIDHGNLCLTEIQSDYFTLFHDDDLMLPNYVANFWKAWALFPEAVVFGTNAEIENHGGFSGASFKATRNYVGPISPDDLLRRYFSHHQLGIAPLPSYIYKKSALGGLRFDVNGGKYSDVQWLSQWARKGSMIWISEPMMVYRLHDGSDGNFESRKDRLRFLAFLKASGALFSPDVLSDYRNFLCKKILPTLIGKEQSIYKYRHRTLSKFIEAHRCRRLFRFSFYKALINKVTTRIYLHFFKKLEI